MYSTRAVAPPAMLPNHSTTTTQPMYYSSPDDFLRGFTARMSHLHDPVLREVLDPLVIDAQNFAQASADGGSLVVGCIESQLLRAPKNQKYALCVFIDALCRARSQFAFKSQFAINLERIFTSAYHEADEQGKTKMIRLLKIWKSGNRGVFLFDPLLMDRIIARCDPDYDGEPADSLPKPRLGAYSSAAMPVQQPQQQQPTYASYPQQQQQTSYIQQQQYAPPPVVQPQQPPTQDMLYLRATELLRNLYAQMNITDVNQQMPLGEIHRANPELYQQIMAQAYREVVTAAPVVPPSSSSVSKPPTPPLLLPMLLSKLNAQNVLERDNLVSLTSAMSGGGVPPKKKAVAAIKSKNIDGTIRVRAWFLNEQDWLQGKAAQGELSMKLFDAAVMETKKSARASPETVHESSVPKDETQTRCALSGEEFETFWSNDEQAWMYKDTIRPDPKGPIYKLHAWLASQRGGGAAAEGREVKRSRFE